MGVGLVRSLQPPDILWIHWRVYNSIANTSKGVLFLPPSDVYVRSFLYLLYTLIKLYYTKALSDQALSLAPDWILLLWRLRIPASFRCSATTFQFDSWVRKFPWRRDRLPIPVFLSSPGVSDGKESTCNTGDLGSNPGLGRSPGEAWPPTPVILSGEFPWTEEPGGL